MTAALPAALDVSYHVDGTGTPLLWAGGINSVVYDVLLERYPRTTANRTVISFDYRSATEVDRHGLEQSTRAYAADALRVLDRLGIDNIHLVGTGGLGAMVMLQVGIAAPELVRAAAIVQGTLKMDLRWRWIIESMLTLRRHAGFEACQKLMLAMVHTTAFIEEHGESLTKSAWDSFADPAREVQQAAFHRACEEHDVSEAIHLMTAPTIVLAGDETDHQGTWAAGQLHAAMPNSELVLVPGAPHAMWESRELLDQFDHSMASFFAGHPIGGDR